MSGGAVLCDAGLDPHAGAVVQSEEVAILGDDADAIRRALSEERQRVVSVGG